VIAGEGHGGEVIGVGTAPAFVLIDTINEQVVGTFAHVTDAKAYATEQGWGEIGWYVTDLMSPDEQNLRSAGMPEDADGAMSYRAAPQEGAER